VRAPNADRDQVIDVLKAAFVQGRLTKDELDLRVGRALTSRTYAEQAAVIADLPAGLIRAEQPVIRPGRAGSPARGNAEVRTGLRVIGVATVLAALFWVIAIVARDNEPAFIVAFGTTGVVLVAAALTGSAALGSWLDRRRDRQPPRPLAGRQARSCLPGAGTTDRSARKRSCSADLGDEIALLDDVALGHMQHGHRTRAFGQDGDLHLHRLQDDQGVTVIDVIALGRDHLPHVRDHLRADLSHGDSLVSALSFCVVPSCVGFSWDAACLSGTYRSLR
jgi:hypothetical protein